MGTKTILWLSALVACLAVSGCGGSSADSADAIRIGVVVECGGTFANEHQPTLAGVELPFIQHGATLRETKPSQGISGASIAGRPVRLLTACNTWEDRSTTIAALSTLVERDGADVVIGPQNVGDGIAVREFARRHPHVTFIATSFEQSTTLKRSVPNVFRFEPDFAQWSGGTGTYARRVLGWNSAVTLGPKTQAGEPTVLGFDAEFCSLGGTITTHWPNLVHGAGVTAALDRTRVDGAYLPGDGFHYPGNFIHHWRAAHPDLGRHLLVGSSVLTPNRDLLGVVGSNSDPYKSTRAWRRYANDLKRTFRNAWHPFDSQPGYDAMEPVREALELVHGDTSHGERRLMAALAHLRYHSPAGLITLDKRHQAIAPIYLGKVVRTPAGGYRIKQIAVVKHVDQSFGGYFTPHTPSPSATGPACVHGNPPAWARATSLAPGSTR